MMLKIIAFVSALIVAAAPALSNENVATPELHRLGMALYKQNCTVCHGPSGQGDGSLANEFSPKPRNFTVGTFRFISTKSGDAPARKDIETTIRRGIEGSYGRTMPAFPGFSSSEILALTEVVRQFAGIETYGEPVEVPPRTAVDVQEIASIYESLGCATCHGDTGKGDGPAAQGMKDVQGDPIQPADFTVGKFKGGNSPKDLWLRIHNGVPGTPMPSFGQNASVSDIWALVLMISALGAK